ncbi:hypothetical protein KI387_027811, partial [Taxus chinensis]
HDRDWKKGDRNAPFEHKLSPIFGYIGFELETVTPTCIQGHLVVSERSAQTYGVLHGGMSAFIAESLGSLGASVASGLQQVAGVELSISHLQPAHLGLEIEVKQFQFILAIGYRSVTLSADQDILWVLLAKHYLVEIGTLIVGPHNHARFDRSRNNVV